LAIGLGGVGIKLSHLVVLYAGLARQGTTPPLNVHFGAPPPQARRLMEPVAAWYVGNVLIGSPPPENGTPGRIAFKTGTSYGYHDAWSIGFDGEHAIGVWVGRPDGAPVPGLVERLAAAPILFDTFARKGVPPAALPRAPKGVLVTTSAKLPPPLQRFQPGRLAGTSSQASLRILFPPDGARLDPATTDGKTNAVPLKITGAVAPLTVLVNGVPVPEQGRGALFFRPDGPGFSRVTVIDSPGATATAVVRVDHGSAAKLTAR
jgi:penicillin-binding protein 1C